MSRGPLHPVVVVNGVVAIVAVLALIVSLVAFSQRLNTIQQSRIKAAHDFCVTFQRVIEIASDTTHAAAGRRFLVTTGLSDCNRYALMVTR